MTETTLLVSASNIPMIKYEGIRVKLADLLKWKTQLSELNVDLDKVIVFSDRDLHAAFLRCALDKDIAVMKLNESIIPVNEKIDFLGLKVFENGIIVMKVYIYDIL